MFIKIISTKHQTVKETIIKKLILLSLKTKIKIANEKLPVEERVLDWQKYMNHKGKLKYSTGVFLSDVEPFPRLKIMMLCDILMGLYKEMPDKFKYKHISYEYTKYIMKIVDENESIIDIESKLPNVASVEILIESLHNEVSLLRNLISKMTGSFRAFLKSFFASYGK